MTTAWSRGRIDDGPVPARGERFEQLAEAGGAVVEGIVSSSEPDPVVHLQDHDELVLLVSGRATLAIEGEGVVLRAGDWLLIPAGVAHRVTATTSGTTWLAVHLPATPPGA